MNILLYLIAFIPLVCLLGVGHTLIPICESYNGELNQACLKDAGNLVVYGVIISFCIVTVMLYSDNRKPKHQSFTNVGVNQ